MIQMRPDTVRMAEVLTSHRAIEHCAALVTAMNQAAEWARAMQASDDPDEGARGIARAEIYTVAVSTIEQAFVNMEQSLNNLRKDAVAAPAAPSRAELTQDAPRSTSPEGANVVRIEKRAPR